MRINIERESTCRTSKGKVSPREIQGKCIGIAGSSINFLIALHYERVRDNREIARVRMSAIETTSERLGKLNNCNYKPNGKPPAGFRANSQV